MALRRRLVQCSFQKALLERYESFTEKMQFDFHISTSRQAVSLQLIILEGNNNANICNVFRSLFREDIANSIHESMAVLMRVSVGDALFVNELYIDIVKPFFVLNQ